MNMENETVAARALEHDVRNQLGNICLAVEGIKAEQTEANESMDIYTDIIVGCCKQIENILKRGRENQ